MDLIRRYNNRAVALLFIWSAILLCSCSEGKSDSLDIDRESLMTEQIDSLVLISSENGKTSSRFATPIMERYEFAAEPFREFRKGVEVVTYDSIGVVQATLIADYAIFFEKQKLWEAKGNVVATNSSGEKLETQQLYWNQRTKKIYSNVDSKVSQGEDRWIGEGFESDEKFQDWVFRKAIGKMRVNTQPNEEGGSSGFGDGSPDGESPTAKSEVAEPKPKQNQKKSPPKRPKTVKEKRSNGTSMMKLTPYRQ